MLKNFRIMGRMKILISISILAIALVGICESSYAAEWKAKQWEHTTYYRFTFNNSSAPTGAALRVTAVDEFELFFNGKLVTDSGNEWKSMDEYIVSLERRANHIGVVVRNSGGKEGNGILLELDTEEKSWISTTAGLNELWLWTAEPQEEGEDVGWLIEDTFELNKLDKWNPVQQGNMDRTLVTEWEDTLGTEVIAGFAGGVDLSRPEGGITLRSIEGENLAIGRRSLERGAAFDGRPNTWWTVRDETLNGSATIDLLTRRLVSEVRVLTNPAKDGTFEPNSLVGFAVQVSNDLFQWTEVGVFNNILETGNFERPSIQFAPIFARYVRVVISQVIPQRISEVAEIQVLGQGAVFSGTYHSAALDLGIANAKNFGRVRWWGEIPEGASISLQFRSADQDEETAWSDWSEEIVDSEAVFSVPEPKTLLQYRVNMSTEFVDVVPRLDSLAIEFSDTFPVSEARGWVVPNSVVLGRDTTFTYTLDLSFGAGDGGVERLFIAMPSLATDVQITLPEGITEKGRVILGDGLEISFAEPGWNSDGTLEISFVARLLTGQFVFFTQLFGPGEVDALNSDEDTIDGSWRVRAMGARGPVLSKLRLNPGVITPNGDGSNDATVVEFTLSRVSEPQDMEISILDLSGRVIRQLESRLVGGQYLRPPLSRDASEAPGFWDGRDDDGDVVPPGIYLVRVRAVLGREEEIRVRPVAVAY